MLCVASAEVLYLSKWEELVSWKTLIEEWMRPFLRELELSYSQVMEINGVACFINI